MTLLDNELWPRDAEHRYRLYARIGNELEVLAATPTAAGLGQAIIALHEDARNRGRRLADRGQIGVLDVLPDNPMAVMGEWIILPWNREA